MIQHSAVAHRNPRHLDKMLASTSNTQSLDVGIEDLLPCPATIQSARFLFWGFNRSSTAMERFIFGVRLSSDSRGLNWPLFLHLNAFYSMCNAK